MANYPPNVAGVASISSGTGVIVNNADPENPIVGIISPVSAANGGTGGDSSAATGVAHVASGTWSYSAVNLASADATGTLPASKGGTGLSTSGTNATKYLKSNGAGGWVLETPAGGGTVTAVTAASPLASSGGTTPQISLSGTVGAANGGTGLGAPASGDAGKVLTAKADGTYELAAGSGGGGAFAFNSNIDNPNLALLLHCESAGFPDTSFEPQPIAAGAGATLDTTVYKVGTGSLALNGNTSNGKIVVSTNSSANLLANDFTFEFWMKDDSSGSLASFIVRNPIGAGTFESGAYGIYMISGAVEVYAYDYSSGTAVVSSGATTINDGAWHHVAWTRSGTDSYLYVDGNLVDTRTGWNTSIVPLEKAPIWIGNDSAYTSRVFRGNLDEIRILNGTAAYTPALYPSGFTPPAVPFANGYTPSELPVAPTLGQAVLSTGGLYTCINATGPVWKRALLQTPQV